MNALKFKKGDTILFVKGIHKGRVEKIIGIDETEVYFILLKSDTSIPAKKKEKPSSDSISFYYNDEIVI